MGSNEHETEARARHVCPVCKQPVQTVIKRHKSLGVFVPVWRPGPCQNSDCSAYEAQEEPERRKRESHS
nr:hypothetical protein [Streptomyces sp. Wb2n-11]